MNSLPRPVLSRIKVVCEGKQPWKDLEPKYIKNFCKQQVINGFYVWNGSPLKVSSNNCFLLIWKKKIMDPTTNFDVENFELCIIYLKEQQGPWDQGPWQQTSESIEWDLL